MLPLIEIHHIVAFGLAHSQVIVRARSVEVVTGGVVSMMLYPRNLGIC